MAAGSTGERPFFEIITSIRYWVIFLAGFFFVSTGLAYDAFGTPRPDAYFQATESKAPVVSQRYQGKTQLDQRLQ
jgi:photosystem II cytochrome b559 subunit alpha